MYVYVCMCLRTDICMYECIYVCNICFDIYFESGAFIDIRDIDIGICRKAAWCFIELIPTAIYMRTLKRPIFLNKLFQNI